MAGVISISAGPRLPMTMAAPSIVTEDGSAEKASVRPVFGAPMDTSPRSLNAALMRPLSRAISWAMSAEATPTTIAQLEDENR